jgi:LysR family transcriptional regulator, carnitine catabolism transcriptional activator
MDAGQTVNLLDTQIGLVEAEQGIAIIPSFGIPDCRRGLTMSELTEPVVSLEFYQITRRGGELRAEAADFSQLLKMFIARGAGEASIL